MNRLKMIFAVLAVLWGGELLAQGIDFKHISFEEALVEAKRENKLVFIDFYTVWCAPCKMMSASVFTDAKVGGIYNSKFINIKLDAEKEGRAAARKFGVSAYPTLAFITPDGELAYKSTGSRNIAKTIELAGNAESSRFSDYSLTNLKELYPEKQNDENFLKLYVDKMIEYGQSPVEGLEAWLAIQTEIKEDDVDMMEFLFKHKKYLLVDGKAEEILKANYDEFFDIATRTEEVELKRLQAVMVYNTKAEAYRTGSPELMRAFITNWKELPEGPLKSGSLDTYELDYVWLTKDGDAFKQAATNYIDSMMSVKSLEQIRKEDKAYYEEYKATKYMPSLMGNSTLANLELGREALAQTNEIESTGYKFLRFCESKKDFKTLESWIEYGDQLIPSDYAMDNLRAAMLYKQGNATKAIEYKEIALNKLSENSKYRSRVERELNKMKQGQEL
ncbi:thioredoxin family protein [Mangrovibacterium lignilyticum]|uniref:thioredoxin family protein n=1 Tax=Mangrovibacterium lignilyticum TaxID=2668052 RepID=UPI0013D24C67|nr:thioredoxin domain-containing protein [Mangrovibacterium lignilyticum]